MLNKELLVSEERHEIVTMSGEGMEDTVSKIFAMLRKQVYEEIKKPVVQMETTSVIFQKVDCVEKHERYMFFFMPRVKKYYTVTADITVSVKYLNLEKEDN